MKFLGENKLFEMALKYWDISPEKAFEVVEKVKYKTPNENNIRLESLVIYFKDGTYYAVYNYEDNVGFLYFSDNGDLTIVRIDFIESESKENIECVLDPCEYCDCAFYPNEPNFYNETIPFHGCEYFVLDKPFIDYD